MVQDRNAKGAMLTSPATNSDTARIFPTSMVVPATQRTGAIPVPSASDAFVRCLVELGIEQSFAVFGGAIASFCEALSRSPIGLMHCRHEAGAAFAAIEASLASNRPTLVVSTSGPGVTNLMTGMVAARWEGAKVIFVSGCTTLGQRGRGAFQETSANETFFAGMYATGGVCHYAHVLEDCSQLPTLVARLAAGLSRPSGFVAHIGLPVAIQSTPTNEPVGVRQSIIPVQCDPQAVEECYEILREEPFLIWAGFGARHAANALRSFAERANVKVVCSPRAKGILSEGDPRLLGVTGLGGYGRLEQYLKASRPKRLLVLGTRLSEMTSFWERGLIPENGLIHVDCEPDAFGAAFPDVPTLAIQAEIGAFLQQLLERWPDRSSVLPILSVPPPLESALEPEQSRCVRPRFLMQTVQREIVDGSSCIVLTEAGNAFLLGNHYLRFPEPGRYRVSTGFGSMGHAAAGVIGATVGSGKKAVAIVGDGSMLMLNELNTAVSYQIPAVWIVLNDARYGMIAQGMRSLGWVPFETNFARTDFVAIARAMGADGIRVEDEADLATALRLALRDAGPFVVDVIIDPNELAPAGRRNQSLRQQGVGKTGP